MATIAELDLPTLALLSPEFQTDPAAVNAAARARGWLAKVDLGGVAVLDDAHCRQILEDQRFHGAITMNLALQGITSGPLWDRVSHLLLALEGDAHATLRHRLDPAFTTEALGRLRKALRTELDRAVDQVAARGRADAVIDLAARYPMTAVLELVGVGADRAEAVGGWIDVALDVLGPGIAAQAAAIEQAFTSLEAELATLAAARRATPCDDLVSALVTGSDGGSPMSDAGLAVAVESFVLPGVDVPRAQLAAGIQAFCEHPDQWQALADHPELAGPAADEVVRWCPVLVGTYRVAAVEAEVDGVTFPAGTPVVVMTSSADRDPDAVLKPDTFDITRSSRRHHLGYGAGIHTCLGRHLARIELSEAFALLSTRLGDLALAGPAPWKPRTGVAGPSTLPVHFTAKG